MIHEDTVVDERLPLLTTSIDTSDTCPSTADSKRSVSATHTTFDEPDIRTGTISEAPRRCPAWRSPTAVALFLALWVMSSGIGDALIMPALTRVMESIYCRDHYRIHKPSLIGSDGSDGVKEVHCKIAEIQGNVAMLKGWQIALESVGSLLLAIPFGWFADTYGRKPLMLMLAVSFVLKAAWIQIVCEFPTIHHLASILRRFTH